MLVVAALVVSTVSPAVAQHDRAAVPGGAVGALSSAQTVFGPAGYTTVVWDDTFDTDRLASCRVDSPFSEPPPALRVSGGVLTAGVTGRSGSVLAAPGTGSPSWPRTAG